VNPGLSCGACRACRRGEDQNSDDYTFMGYFAFGTGGQRLFDAYPYGGRLRAAAGGSGRAASASPGHGRAHRPGLGRGRASSPWHYSGVRGPAQSRFAIGLRMTR
jgi:hypothetical protein